MLKTTPLTTAAFAVAAMCAAGMTATPRMPSSFDKPQRPVRPPRNNTGAWKGDGIAGSMGTEGTTRQMRRELARRNK